MNWSREADVVVVGFGGAGASTAITAHEAGAKVLVLEKSAEGGGNTRYSGGSIRTFANKEKAKEHYYYSCEGSTGREEISAFVEEAFLTPDWLRQRGATMEYVHGIGMTHLPVAYDLSAFPALPGADGLGERLFLTNQGGSTAKGGKFLAGGANLWSVLSRRANELGIDVLYSHPGRRLLVDSKHGVIGVEADGPGGRVTIKARRGVVLCAGGFEANHEMHKHYLGATFYPMGTDANDGSGIKMAQEAGADLWHMNAVANTFGYKMEGFTTVFRHEMGLLSPGYVYVDQRGSRFMNEAGTDVHAIWSQVVQLDFETGTLPRVPCYCVFDEDTRRGGPIAEQIRTKASDSYKWSEDNLPEIEKGWITKADTLAELAQKLKMDPTKLQETVARYNINCVGGYDPDFQRLTRTLVPIVRPPFYGIALWPALMNTQGGPRRNAQAQVVNPRGEPVARLYSAGECGSIWGRLYPGGGNVSEAMAYGRIAARNVSKETPWA